MAHKIWFVVCILSFCAGYFHSQYSIEINISSVAEASSLPKKKIIFSAPKISKTKPVVRVEPVVNHPEKIQVAKDDLIVLKPGMLVNPETREVVYVPVKRSKGKDIK